MREITFILPRKRRVSSKVVKQLHTKLKKIKAVVPSAQGWCVIDREGQFIAYVNGGVLRYLSQPFLSLIIYYFLNSESSTAYGENLSNDILCLRNAAHNYGNYCLYSCLFRLCIVLCYRVHVKLWYCREIISQWGCQCTPCMSYDFRTIILLYLNSITLLLVVW